MIDPTKPADNSFIANSAVDIRDNFQATIDELNELRNDLNNIVDKLSPIGGVMYFAGDSVLPGEWQKCNGGELNKNEYPELFNAIGYRYGGAGDIFKKPDARGIFIRGHDDGRGVDPGRELGSWQEDEIKSHNHYTDERFNRLSARASDVDNAATVTVTDSGGATNEYRIGQMGSYWDAATIKDTGGTETRGKNIAFTPIIRVR